MTLQVTAPFCFQRDIADLTEDAEKTYQFPSNDEDFGMVYMGWRVPGNLVKSMQKRWVHICNTTVWVR